jgi:alpha-tubulin suppressor-like RCC1 family protein
MNDDRQLLRLRGCAVMLALACAAGPPRPQGTPFTAISVGDGFACALTTDGTAYCWGRNDASQVGNDTVRVSQVTKPVPVAGNHRFVTLSAGFEHVCALTADGRAWCWGSSTEGALGSGPERARTPRAVAASAKFNAISAGLDRTCAVAEDGAVYCWGRFSRPSDAPAGSGGPEPVRLETPVHFRFVDAVLAHACGITVDADLYCWGSNAEGALGVGSGVRTSVWQVPQRVPLPDKVRDLSVSSVGTCAVTSAHAAYCWGRNSWAQLGNGSVVEPFTPTAIPARVAGDQRWVQVTTAGNRSCGLTETEELFCWGLLPGSVFTGQCDTLATSRGACSTRPKRLATQVRFRHLATRFDGCGIAVDGATYCWGSNAWGELGNGTRVPSAEPTRVTPP